MPLKPETNARKKVEALEHRKAMLDALIAFVKEHPAITSEAVLHSLSGKTGLFFMEYALIRPYWKDGKAVLRLEKFGEDWLNSDYNVDPYERPDRIVAEDVSAVSDEGLEKLLDSMYREVNPDDEDEE